MKNVLIITYYWPPSGGPGVQRILKFSKYLPKYGWNPIILTVKEGDFPVKDISLKSNISDSDVYYSKSFSFHKIFNYLLGKKSTPAYQLSSSKTDNIITKIFRWIRFNLIVPDGRIGWYPNAVKIGSKIIRSNDIRVLFSSAPPYTTHLIAKTLSKKYNIPWAADFRDPWTDYYYYENKRLWITSIIDKHLEKKVINSANALITVSKTISENYKKGFIVIYNGYDEEDFNLVEKKENSRIIISHVGTMSKNQNPSYFFDAVHQLNNDGNKYQIDLIGSVHPDIINDIKINGYDYFINLVEYLPHHKAIIKMCQSDFLLLIITNVNKNMGLISAKIFEYIRSGSKIIMIGPPGGDAEKIINETNSGFCFDYHEKDTFKEILTKNNFKDTENYSKYSRENSTRLLADILNKINK